MCDQTRPKKKEQGIQLPVSHTLSDHHTCHGFMAGMVFMSRMEVFLHQA